LHLWIDRVDEPYYALLPGLQRRECVAVDGHKCL
jgi:hypothetical protein